MKRSSSFLPPVLWGLLLAACARPPGNETLLRYARSQNIYREGRFSETAETLAGENDFAPALILRGKAEYLSGDFASAEKTLKRSLRVKPGDAEASLFLARLFWETGNPEEARKLAEKALGDNPLDIRLLRFAAELARENDASGAAGSGAARSAILLDRAVEASAESAMVFLDRARLRWTGGNGAGALEDLGRAKALLSRDSPVIGALEKLESIISEVSR